jgi:HAE1 family hydrophobic/amphiphilic exporter-1
MFSEFFIKHPVFASVCAIVILLVGAVSIPTLPIAQYPDITPPQVTVSANYSGASAEVVESAVTNVLEREINGVQGLRYISSSSSNSGTSSINVTFESSRDPDLAAVDVRNRVSIAQPQLPDTVQRTGVTVQKQTSGFLMAIGIFAENNRYDPIFLSNYSNIYLADALKRINGVGNVQIFGERRYAMRLWINPDQLASHNLTMDDVVTAVNNQNLQVGIGRIGQQPTPKDDLFQIDLEAQSRLTDVSQFENIVLRSEADGTLIKLKDVGRAELGAQDYSTFLRFRGNQAVGIGIQQLPGSNALQVATAVKAEIARLSKQFPPGLQYQIAFDTTQFVQVSLKEVIITLLQAIALVILVIFIFLQDWRTTIIPAIAIPTSLVGTFIFIKLFNFSINSLTLFGLTLATGLVVDDAIIVVENISRLIQDRGLNPARAALEGMRELSGAVIATSLVLMAVFVPVAFFPGITGALYRQFALTIAFSIGISAFIALTLTPALSALMLRQGQQPPRWLNWFFRPFNRTFEKGKQGYRRSLNVLTGIKSLVIGIFVLLLAATAFLYLRVPTGFLPEEDQGYFLTLVQGPEGVSLNYTSDVMRQVEDKILSLPAVAGTFAVGGFSFGGSTANSGIIFTNLKPWDERGQDQSVQAILGQLRREFSTISKAQVQPLNPPAIQGLGALGGFTFELQDQRVDSDLNSLVQALGKLLQQANQNPALQSVFSTFAANTPKLEVQVNRDAAEALHVPVDEIFSMLETTFGSRYVNDFTLQQRNYRVYVQADQQFRTQPDDLKQLYVRSTDNQMVPLSNLVTLQSTSGAQTISHFNLFRAIEVTGSAAPGHSSGQALNAMEQVAANVLPPGLGYAWSGTALEQQQSGNQAPLIFGLGLVFVFLVLAAQYENYFDPIIIILAVPLAILGALLAQSLRGLENDVYCQIGLVMLIGLASKNSILIVEFANQLRQDGRSITRAAIEAAQERLRPILMTSFAALLGFFPLVIATGAGAAARRSLGTAVFGGLLVSTFLSLLVVPILYIVITALSQHITSRLPSPTRMLREQPDGTQAMSARDLHSNRR